MLSALRSGSRAASAAVLTRPCAASLHASAASGQEAQDGESKQMNLCTAVNEALHIAMSKDDKCVRAGGGKGWRM